MKMRAQKCESNISPSVGDEPRDRPLGDRERGDEMRLAEIGVD